MDRLPYSIGKGSLGLAQLAAFSDSHFLDGAISALGFVSRLISVFSAFTDVGLVDGLFRKAAHTIHQIGRRARELQSGILSDYLWNAFVTVLLLIAFLILFQRL